MLRTLTRCSTRLPRFSVPPPRNYLFRPIFTKGIFSGNDEPAAAAPEPPRAPSPSTKIEKLLLDSIKATGPLPFSTYMQMCLSHPTHGYYTNPEHEVFGRQGDFITSPEISQVFGELLAVWLISQWMDKGLPPIRLVELGPGRGTLMEDVLRVFAQLDAVKSHLTQVHLVETSLTMRALQQERLAPRSTAMGFRLDWYDSIYDIKDSPDEYTMLIAHEFFDALPIHLLQKSQQGWHEVLVASQEYAAQQQANSTSTSTTPKYPFHRVLTPTPTPISSILGSSSPRFQTIPEGGQLEVSPFAFRMARQVGFLLSQNRVGGAGLIIDYGGDNCFGDSFRAFKDHKLADVFEQPGECDLTANVDFAYLKESMADLVTPHGPLPQGEFLESMGLGIRLK
ncbi:DUF185-domain-containing protein, partial [Pluteus cervinus]